MTSVYVAWALSAIVTCVVAIILGTKAIGRGWLGILIDERGRYSLTRIQLTAWTVIILSLVFGVFWGRLLNDASTALDFSIPSELLTVLGISVGSTVLSTTIKTAKDNTEQSANVAASDDNDKPRLSQIFLVEEGKQADRVIDVSKFQTFWITVMLLVAYVFLAAKALHDLDSPGDAIALPGFDQQFVILLAISHGGYLLGKIPNKPGAPQGLTVAGLQAGATPAAPITQPSTLPTYAPRNPAPAT